MAPSWDVPPSQRYTVCVCVCNEVLACEWQKAASSTGDTFDLSSVPCWRRERGRGTQKNGETERNVCCILHPKHKMTRTTTTTKKWQGWDFAILLMTLRLWIAVRCEPLEWLLLHEENSIKYSRKLFHLENFVLRQQSWHWKQKTKVSTPSAVAVKVHPYNIHSVRK